MNATTATCIYWNLLQHFIWSLVPSLVPSILPCLFFFVPFFLSFRPQEEALDCLWKCYPSKSACFWTLLLHIDAEKLHNVISSLRTWNFTCQNLKIQSVEVIFYVKWLCKATFVDRMISPPPGIFSFKPLNWPNQPRQTHVNSSPYMYMCQQGFDHFARPPAKTQHVGWI